MNTFLFISVQKPIMPQAPYCVYQKVVKQKPAGITIYPVYLKQILYGLMHKGLLTAKREYGVCVFLVTAN